MASPIDATPSVCFTGQERRIGRDVGGRDRRPVSGSVLTPTRSPESGSRCNIPPLSRRHRPAELVLETHQLVIGGVGVVVGVGLGDAHGHAVGEYGQEDEDVKGLEDSLRVEPGEPSVTCGDGLRTQEKDISTPPGPAPPCGWGC